MLHFPMTALLHAWHGGQRHGILAQEIVSLDFNVTMQFCIAHLIRDIRFLKTLPDEETKAYGKRLLNEVKNMFKVIHERDNMIPEDFTIALLY